MFGNYDDYDHDNEGVLILYILYRKYHTAKANE